MTLEPERQSALDDAIIESLLREFYVADPNDERRIASILNAIECEATEATTTDSSSTQLLVNLRFQVNRWVSLAIAACVLLVAGLVFTFFSRGNAAYAVVMRSLEVTPKIRAYRMQMVHQHPLWGNREVTADLYLNDQDQFAVRHPGWSRFGEVWIGGDAKSRWVVPRFGPAFVGGEEIVGSWLAKKDIPSPYLHVSTILHRMSRVYHLTMNDDTTLTLADSGEIVACQQIIGELRGFNKTLPSKIELWAKLDSGIAQRLELTWQRAESERGPIRWTIDLMDSPELPSNWFILDGHINEGRRVVSIKSIAELEDVENDDQ
ncbi:MAG: hypothetical protein ACK56W_10190 [Pirellula sp.]|jgi:hypothetical protein|nr:hypothetical protein [Pirellula sp.]